MIFLRPGDDLQEKLQNASPNEVVCFAEGEYRAKLTIDVPGLKLVGAGMDRTIIYYDDYAKKLDKNGLEYNTFRTWTIAICADGVAFSDMTIENRAGSPEKRGQEVALSVYGDGFTMERCRLTSTQDTLFLGPLPRDLIQRYEGFLPDKLRRDIYCRQNIKSSVIEGTVDFIFGCGEAVFEDCEIRSLYDVRQTGYCAAPAHPIEQSEGFTFMGCRFTRAEAVPDGSVHLARPWRDYGLAKFISCTYDSHIAPVGFDKWNDTDRDRTARFYEKPKMPGRAGWAREE